MSIAVQPGTYSSTETVPSDWNLTDVSCDDGNSSGDTGTATARFNVEPGESVTCTFTNTKWGSIGIEKQTLPDSDPATFAFNGYVGGNLGDGQTVAMAVRPGQYGTTETVPAGWDLTDITCNDANSSGDTGTSMRAVRQSSTGSGSPTQEEAPTERRQKNDATASSPAPASNAA